MKEHLKTPLTLATINVVECYDVVPQFIKNCKESNWRICPILELKYGFAWGGIILELIGANYLVILNLL